MTHIIDKNLPSPRPTSKTGTIRAWIADTIGVISLFGTGYGLMLIGYGFGG